MNAVALENVEFSYGKTDPVISILDLRIEKGGRIFLHGPSGSGKTTFLGLITGILTPTQGKLEVLGQNMATLSEHQRDRFRADRMGYIFQQFNLIPYLSVIENILLSVWMSKEKRLRVKEELEAEAMSLASRLGLSDLLTRNVLRLSVGQQQRVAVARALIGKPELVIADEPTSALDEDRQQEFIDLLLDKAQDKSTTILFVSHNQKLAARFDQSISLPEINRVKS